MAFTLVTGDNALVLHTLKVGASAFDCSGLTVTSRIVGKCGTSLTDAISNSDATAGADWANGIVAVQIPGAETASINPSKYPEVMLETQVDDGTYQKTWFATLDCVAGTID